MTEDHPKKEAGFGGLDATLHAITTQAPKALQIERSAKKRAQIEQIIRLERLVRDALDQGNARGAAHWGMKLGYMLAQANLKLGRRRARPGATVGEKRLAERGEAGSLNKLSEANGIKPESVEKSIRRAVKRGQ